MPTKKKYKMKLSEIFKDYEPNMSFQEIANVMGCHRNNVIEIYQLAMTKLIKQYGEKNDD